MKTLGYEEFCEHLFWHEFDKICNNFYLHGEETYTYDQYASNICAIMDEGLNIKIVQYGIIVMENINYSKSVQVL